MTIRTLVILRHAKAADPAGRADRDRPLTPRGHADAAVAGVWLGQHGYAPEFVLCSPARRTRETWHGAAVALAVTPEVSYDSQVYDGGAHTLVDLINTVDDRFGTAVLVGHNPSVSQLSVLLDPEEADPDGLRTCGLAVHTLSGSWALFAPGHARLAQKHTARA